MAALQASDDPMIEIARALEAPAREARLKMEQRFEGPMRQQHERLARARLAVYGNGSPPDATFTLRLSYGTVNGWREGDKQVPPFTTVAGAYARHTGAEPFALPERWLAAQERLPPQMPFNLSSTHDAVGGNSGSPMIDREARIVGVFFDGNIHSLGGRYGYDAQLNRAVALSSELIVKALEQVYGNEGLAAELRGTP